MVVLKERRKEDVTALSLSLFGRVVRFVGISRSDQKGEGVTPKRIFLILSRSCGKVVL
jgi:hypothetical protein